jgi:hypothetical protein
LTIEKDNGYAMSLKSSQKTLTILTGFCCGYAIGQLGAINVQVSSRSLAALHGFTAPRNSFIAKQAKVGI